MANNIRINNRVASTLQVGGVYAEGAYYGSPLVYTPSFFDEDAITYIDAVESADGEPLELEVRVTINNFVSRCKADGTWDAIKASCILAGARTLNGCLVPLVGSAPTNFNFVSGDYNRVTGLKGDGSTKYLDSNRANDADPLNSKSASFYCSDLSTASPNVILGMVGRSQSPGADGMSLIRNTLTRLNSTTINDSYTAVVGFIGMSRGSSSSYVRRNGEANTTVSTASTSPPQSNNMTIYADEGGAFGNPRLAFYAFGEDIDLAALDARVAALMTEIEAALT